MLDDFSDEYGIKQLPKLQLKGIAGGIADPATLVFEFYIIKQITA